MLLRKVLWDGTVLELPRTKHHNYETCFWIGGHVALWGKFNESEQALDHHAMQCINQQWINLVFNTH